MNQADNNSADLTTASENQTKSAFNRAVEASEELKAAIKMEALLSAVRTSSLCYPSWH